MKRASASRLVKAGIAFPVAVAGAWLGAKVVAGAAASADFMPHGYCYLWDSRVIWLHVISDGLITVSYYCIPLALVYLIRKRQDLPFNWIFWMFGLFILGCGTTHLMEIWTIWHASYFLAGIIKGITAAVSVVTAAMLIPLIPKAIALPSVEQLRGVNYQLKVQVVERERAEQKLKETLAVRERTLTELANNKSAVEELRQAQGAVRESQDRLNAIIQSAMDAILTIDEEQRIVLFNAAAEKMFGCEASQALGGPIARFIPERFRALHASHIHRFSEAGTTSRTMGTLGAIWGRRANGEEFPLEASISQVASGGNKLFTVILRDITERKRAEEALKESLAAREQALKETADQKFALDQHAIVATTDVQGTITYVNDKFCAISKYSREELLGQNHRILNSGHHPKEFFQQMYHTIANGRVWRGEICNRAKDGWIYWVDTTIVPFAGEDGKPRQYVAIRADITERKRAEEALRESLATSRVALKDLADQKFALDQHAIVATTDVQGTITYVNEKFCAISKYSRQELVGQNHRILNSAHHSADFFRNMYRTIANGQVWRDEICNRAKDGSLYWVDTTIVPLLDAYGKPRQYMAIRADITERKRAEEARGWLAALVESSDDAILGKTLEGAITAWNRGAEKIFGYSSSEVVGKTMLMLMPPERAHEELDILARIRRGESVEHFETVRVRKDGKRIDVSVTISPIRDSSGAVIGASKITRDITERKQAEARLAGQTEELSRQAEELARSQQALATQTLMLQSVLDSMQEGLVAADEQGKFIIWNPAATKIVGMGAADVPPEQWTDHYGTFLPDTVTPFPPEENPLLCAIRGEACTVEMYVRNPKLETGVWIEACASPLKSKDGLVRGGVVAFRDITQRKRDEREIRKLNDELEQRVIQRTAQLEAANQELADQKLALDQHAIVAMTDIEGNITYVNDKFCAISQYSRKELIGQNHRILKSGHHSPEFFQEMYHTISSGKVWQGEVMNRAKDGSFHWLDTTIVPFSGAGGKPRLYAAIRADITERKLAQERLLQRTADLEAANQELEAFTYSVSHDLRAPLRHIGGFSKILIEDFGAAMDPEARHHLERIGDGVHRMGLLVDELLNLARVGRHALKFQLCNLNSIVEEVTSLLHPEVEGRSVSWKIAKLPSLECDPILVKQVFQNLIANALKFTRPREHAIIEIDQIHGDGQTAILVRDNGVGFNMKYQDKLFGVFQRLHRAEDFEGTGIGLATVQRIIHKHGGRVWAEGEPDKGATFYFTLSAVGAALATLHNQNDSRAKGFANTIAAAGA